MLKEKGIIHIPAVLFLVGVLVLSLTFITSLKQPSYYNQFKDVKGTLIAKGDDNKDNRNDDRDDDEANQETPKPTSTSDTSESKTKTEIRFSEGEKIKTRVEEGRTRIDVTSGGVKVRYEIRDGRVIIKAETEEGEDVEDEDEEIVKIIDRLDKTGIKVATAGGRLVVARNQIGAVSNFPLQIDLATNSLIASTSAGTRVLTILPDQAVQNMLAANVISRLGAPFIRQAVEGGEATQAAQIIQLGLRAGVPVYEIPGIRDFRLLGFIPISAPVTAVVSAETGQLVTTDQPVLTRIIDLLSP